MNQPPENQQDVPGANASGRFTRVGIALILLSGVFWFSLFAVPFLPFTTGSKALIAGAIFIAVQITWWLGAALAGPRVVRKVTGWFRRSGNAGR